MSETRWLLYLDDDRFAAGVQLVVATERPSVISAIEDAAEAAGIKLVRVAAAEE